MLGERKGQRYMRGKPQAQPEFLTTINLNQRVPVDHPLRGIKERADKVLAKLSPLFDELYADEGRPSIPPVLIYSLPEFIPQVHDFPFQVAIERGGWAATPLPAQSVARRRKEIGQRDDLLEQMPVCLGHDGQGASLRARRRMVTDTRTSQPFAAGRGLPALPPHPRITFGFVV